MPNSDSRESRDDSVVDRRRMLAVTATGLVGSLSGCGSSTSGAKNTPTETATSTPTEAATGTATKTSTSGFDTSVLDQSPSSAFAPTSGFGSLGWLDGQEPRVLKVTTLEKRGEGSLRWALDQQGPRVVVFEVGGVVDLEGQNITVEQGKVYVAGQTAPSPGISVIRGSLEVEADNVLVQHIRVRPGDQLVEGKEGGEPEGEAVDAMSVGQNRQNVIFDHCSVSWGSDENMSTGGRFRNKHVTFSNNLIAEGLSHSPLHPEEEHSKGTLVMDHASKISVIGNVYLHHTDRHPRIKGGASCAVVNNFVYNFEEAIEMGGGPSEDAVGTVIGNYFHGGPATPDSGVLVYAEGHGAAAYLAYNQVENAGFGTHNMRLERLNERPLWPKGLQTMAASKVPTHNFRTAGARPADRTPHDQRLMTHARKKRGKLIDSQSEVGGYPDLEATKRSLDVPDDGLAEWLYEHTKAVERPSA